MDHFITDGFPLIDRESGGSLRGMIAALDELLPRLPSDARIIPGHGEPRTVANVRSFARSLEEMLAAVAKAKKPVDVGVLAPWVSWNQGFVKAENFLPVLAGEAENR